MEINEKNIYIRYSFVKTCQVIFVDSNIVPVLLKDPNFYSVGFLKSFLSVVEAYNNCNALDDEMRNNILDFVNKIRLMNVLRESNDEKNQKIDIINDIITTVNRRKSMNSESFYRSELYKRFNNPVFYAMNNSQLSEYKSFLFESIKYDRYVLYTHSENVSDDEFIERYLPFIIEVNDDRYCATVNCFIQETPEIFLNQCFYDRCMMVFERRIKHFNDKNENKCIKLQKKFINKFVKKYNQK